MRTAFIEQLCAMAKVDEKIWLVCGDLGYSVLETFADQFPHRYLNAGVAEQNMTGIAAGLALSGKTVFTYSIANFPVMRCLEQIRNDVCYHNLNVKIVSVGGGLAYGSHGYTHHGVEDLAVMSVMPNMCVASPGDPHEARAITRLACQTPGPMYLRLGKAGEPLLHPQPLSLEIGASIQMEQDGQIEGGRGLTLISTGGMLASAMQAGQKLREAGIAVRLLSMPFLVPLDQAAIQRAAEETSGIITIEEHGVGGLGSKVAELLASFCLAVPFEAIRLPSQPIKLAGSQDQLRSSHGVSVESIFAAAKRISNRPHRPLVSADAT